MNALFSVPSCNYYFYLRERSRQLPVLVLEYICHYCHCHYSLYQHCRHVCKVIGQSSRCLEDCIIAVTHHIY